MIPYPMNVDPRMFQGMIQGMAPGMPQGMV